MLIFSKKPRSRSRFLRPRLSSSEAGTALAYSANALNQYVSVGERSGRSDTLVASAVQSENQNDFSSQSDVPAPQGVSAQSASSSEATGVSLLPFSPGYDADGNMTLIQTSTGTWSVSYNAENRPVTWTNSAGEKICMIYDSRGRRAEKRVFNAAGTRTLRERYVYVGYTCVQVLDGDDGNAVVKEFAWDPTEPVATKPLFMFLPQARLSLLYTHDGNKNVADVCYLAPQNGVGAHYEYAPFGALTRVSKNTRVTVPDVISTNPFRFSSEYFDDELGLVYYNFRHYSPTLGRFLSRDPIEEQGGWNLYGMCNNNPGNNIDIRGEVIPIAIGIGIGVGVLIGLIGVILIPKPSPVPPIEIPDLPEMPGPTTGEVITAGCACLLACLAKGINVSRDVADTCRKRRDPGDCTQEQHDILQEAVDKAKGTRKCAINDSCMDLYEKITNWSAEIRAREIINNTCYRGGDDGHKQALAQAQTNVQNCQRLIMLKCMA